MKVLTIIITILLCVSCIGVIKTSNLNKDELSTIPNLDSLILSEIACISFNNIQEEGKMPTKKLIEVLLARKTDSSMVFQKGNLYTSEVIVDILTENSKIKEILYIHYKLGVILPDSVINDIEISKLLNVQSKVFRSEDKKRVYILIRDIKKYFEVIWVINNDKYYSRFVNK